jgi:hypothetical protein
MNTLVKDLDLTVMSETERDRYLKQIQEGVQIYQLVEDGTYVGSIEGGDPLSPVFPLFRSQQEARDYGEGNNQTLRITLRQARSEVFWFAYQ